MEQQVLAAMDAAGFSGLSVAVPGEGPHVFRGFRAGRQVEVEVWDAGPGAHPRVRYVVVVSTGSPRRVSLRIGPSIEAALGQVAWGALDGRPDPIVN